LEGLPELQELNMYGNNVTVIVVPSNSKLLSKLEILDLGYNNVSWLPDELDQLKALRTLKVMNNLLSKVSMRICDMDLKVIDVSSNPVTEPPFETCERGICSMRRYWQCIRAEEQSKKKTLAEVHKKVNQKPKKGYSGFMGIKMRSSSSSGRKAGSADLSITSNQSVSSSTVTESPIFRSQQRPTNLASLPRDESGLVKHAVSDSVVSKSSVPILTTSHLESKVSNRSDSVVSVDGAIADGSSLVSYEELPRDQVSVNDTLKVIFVGMALVGKTSMIKRLIEGKDTVIPTIDERTIGVDIYDWEPKVDKRFEHIDSHIEIGDEVLREACGDVEVKFSVWDFAGQHVYHATHELFFSNRALYVLVWDMGATNSSTLRKKAKGNSGETGAFKLYDSSDEEDGESDNEVDLALEEEERRADRALEHDIDEKVQFWIDCIQSTSPGAAILPVASFDDAFTESNGGVSEAKRRCRMLKQRLLKHEERRVSGIESRLQELRDQNRAGDTVAKRLRKLLCPFTRPKLIFGDDDDSLVRVSGTKYTGFDRLTEKIIGIATGKDLAGRRYPLFHGHIGARIPRMRLEVRDAVREMRGSFKVVEWGYFVNALRDRGLTSVEDISDALHFLTNIGELSYFGSVMLGAERSDMRFMPEKMACQFDKQETCRTSDRIDDEDDIDEEDGMLSMDDTSITAPSTTDGSLSTVEDFMSGGLSQYVFLNPRWLVAAVACILRHDLDIEIKETRRLASAGKKRDLSRTASFYDGHLSCPVITADDARLLWQNKRITKKAAERAQEYSNNLSVTPFDFLQRLLIRFGVFVPIDLSIEKALFGGKEYHQLVRDMNSNYEMSLPPELPFAIETKISHAVSSAEFFFLPSLLGPSEPSDAWSYKSADAWKTVICHSILFPDGVPPGLMERLTASVLSSIYAVSNLKTDTITNFAGQNFATCEGQLAVKEILCWRTAFYIKIGTLSASPDGSMKESVVEIFTHLAGKDSHLCVGSDYMGVGMRRLITCGRGQVGDGGRKIWKGGYLLVCKCIHRVMLEYEGLEFEKEGFCPECLAKKAVSEASSWEASAIRNAVANSEEMLRCQHGHRVDIRLIAGPSNVSVRTQAQLTATGAGTENSSVPVQNLLNAVVVVGLWDGKTRKVVRVGSGFIVDKKRGLIVTAAHTLMNIRGEKQYPFGENYYGLRSGKVVIGVIPKDQESDGRDMAIFRYFAQIVSKDPSFDLGECHLDACVLRITTRMENDVGGDGDGCGDQPEILLLNDQKAMKIQQLLTLKLTEKCELEEQVRIVGYNQGGEGLLGPGVHLNRYVDFAKGYVCMKFVHEQSPSARRTEFFKPREEIVVICPTIGGHSGGPCVNQQGEVVGILSRADPAENQRCYLVPASEIKVLVNRAKKQM
jgi:Ras of Complex, Roc, domain of DAPkinase/Trypsin-like peptidase domain